MIKKVGMIALAVSILMSGGAFANTTETAVETQQEWTYNFSDEKTWLKDMGVKDADLVKLEKLYDEAVALEKANKFDESMKKWDAYYKILEAYEDFSVSYVGGEMTFEDEKAWLEDLKINNTDMASLEKLFGEAVAFSEAEKYDEAEKKWDAYYEILEKYNCFDGVTCDLKFEDEKEWLKELKISSSDMTSLEKLFNEAVSLSKADKHDDANKKWEAYDKILNKYHEAAYAESLNFSDEKEWLKDMKISATDMTSLEKIYNEAAALFKAGKSDEAEKKWEAYDKILNKYYEAAYAESMKFSEQKEWLEELKVSATDMTSLEKLFNEAVSLTKSNKLDEAEKKWAAYDKILEKYYDSEMIEFTGTMSFSDEKEWLKDLKINASDMASLEKLFNEAVALDKSDKYEEASKKWDAYNKIIDKYLNQK